MLIMVVKSSKIIPLIAWIVVIMVVRASLAVNHHYSHGQSAMKRLHIIENRKLEVGKQCGE